MARQQSITLANLICRFGDNIFLLDLAREVVFPAFTDAELRRKFGDTVYLFLNVGYIHVPASSQEREEVCIYGRIVKDTVLHREQVLKAGELMTSPQTLPSAPSAFFTLALSNHKLIYLPETSGAPSLETFGSTLEQFLRIKHGDYIRVLNANRKLNGVKSSITALLNEIPAPTLELVPLASRESIEGFVSSIDKLTHLEFKLLITNREMQARDLYRTIRGDAQQLRAKQSKLSYDNAEGMSKDEVARQIELAAASGNQAVTVAGTAEDGTRLRGNNHQMKLQIPAPELPAPPPQKARGLLDIFRRQSREQRVALDQGDDATGRIRSLVRSLGNGDGGRTN